MIWYCCASPSSVEAWQRVRACFFSPRLTWFSSLASRETWFPFASGGTFAAGAAGVVAVRSAALLSLFFFLPDVCFGLRSASGWRPSSRSRRSAARRRALLSGRAARGRGLGGRVVVAAASGDRDGEHGENCYVTRASHQSRPRLPEPGSIHAHLICVPCISPQPTSAAP